jgi:FCD domain
VKCHLQIVNNKLAGWLLHRRLKPYRRPRWRVRNRVAKSFGEHEQFVAAANAADAERATRAPHDHVAIQGERFSDFIAPLSQPGRFEVRTGSARTGRRSVAVAMCHGEHGRRRGCRPAVSPDRPRAHQ